MRETQGAEGVQIVEPILCWWRFDAPEHDPCSIALSSPAPTGRAIRRRTWATVPIQQSGGVSGDEGRPLIRSRREQLAGIGYAAQDQHAVAPGAVRSLYVGV